MSQIPVALQLYTVRDETAKDFIGTLRRVAAMGYAGVEFAGYGDLPAAELKQVIADLGLQPASSHVGLEALEAGEALDYLNAIGCPFVAVPWMPQELRENMAGWKSVAKRMNAVGEKCKERGITLTYHNHDFEFQKFCNQYGLDILYRNSDPGLVQAELDLYWIKHGSADPVAYIKKYAGRVPLLHCKDMAEDGSFAEVGNGTLDWPAIFAAATLAGTQWYIVEQDTCTRPTLESAEISFNYLKKMGVVG